MSLCRYMQLDVFIADPELKERYVAAAEAHNYETLQFLRGKTQEYNSGFDVLIPEKRRLAANQKQYLEGGRQLDLYFDIQCRALWKNGGAAPADRPTGFYLYPRSSISKTHLRLANNVGIIDAGYRGIIIGKFDILPGVGVGGQLIGTKALLQICAPDLSPVLVRLVDTLEELGETQRGSGGFGSTG